MRRISTESGVSFRSGRRTRLCLSVSDIYVKCVFDYSQTVITVYIVVHTIREFGISNYDLDSPKFSDL